MMTEALREPAEQPAFWEIGAHERLVIPCEELSER
jgi:hypothetical protein